jgi:lysophospholipase L1-like esterase
MDYIIIGDSIAVELATMFSDCVFYAENGITSDEWAKKFKDKDITAKTVIVSLGTNDDWKDKTYDILVSIRNRIVSDRIIWIQPNKISRPWSSVEVEKVAKHFDDEIILAVSWDDIHPSPEGYKNIVEIIKGM